MPKRYAQKISELLPDGLSKTLARKTGMTLDLIASWEDIAGPEYAAFTLPEKIKWQRENDHFGDPKPGTLILACDGHRAIFVQHALPELIECLNAYFGYPAINQIKLVQKPIAKPKAPKKRQKPKLKVDEQARLNEILDHIDNEDLREKLRRMGTGVIARQRKGNQ